MSFDPTLSITITDLITGAGVLVTFVMALAGLRQIGRQQRFDRQTSLWSRHSAVVAKSAMLIAGLRRDVIAYKRICADLVSRAAQESDPSCAGAIGMVRDRLTVALQEAEEAISALEGSQRTLRELDLPHSPTDDFFATVCKCEAAVEDALARYAFGGTSNGPDEVTDLISIFLSSVKEIRDTVPRAGQQTCNVGALEAPADPIAVLTAGTRESAS